MVLRYLESCNTCRWWGLGGNLKKTRFKLVVFCILFLLSSIMTAAYCPVVRLSGAYVGIVFVLCPDDVPDDNSCFAVAGKPSRVLGRSFRCTRDWYYNRILIVAVRDLQRYLGRRSDAGLLFVSDRIAVAARRLTWRAARCRLAQLSMPRHQRLCHKGFKEFKL